MRNLNDVYEKVENKWVSRFILDEVVIMPLCSSQDDMQYIYSISNETGSRIWQLIDGKHSVCEIQEILKSEYQGQVEVIESEVSEFVKDIYEAKLIRKTKLAKSQQATQASRISRRGQSSQKKPYKSPEIAKVKLQPEQAVLTCCRGSGYGKTSGANNTCPGGTPDCTTGCTLGTEYGSTSTASS